MTNGSTFRLGHALDYTGDYFSTELDTWYQVKLEKDQLKLRHFHNGYINLIPAWNDEFRGTQWYANGVEFQRDPDGKITGLYISQYRARNQYFKKMNKDSILNSR